MHKKMRVKEVASDTLKSVSILSLATFIGAFFAKIGFSEANIITVYILGVLVTSIVTKKQIYSLVSSVVSVVIFNFFFTEPKFTLIAYDKGDPFTFLIMFLSAFITGSLAVKLKEHAREAAKTAYRTETLFETNQLLSQAKEYNEIVDVTARQVMKLTKRNVAIYLAQGEKLSEPLLFSNEETPTKINTPGNEEAKAALWTYKNNRSSGTMTETFSKLNWLFLNLKAGQNNFGVVSIDMAETVLDAFENSVLLSMLAECALALENDQNAREKEEAAILAKNEQLRANLLRAISHDLRTPLTSISGNASNLLSNAGSFDEETKQQLYMDIYDDAMWLVNLVENLLSVTRLEDGRMQLHLACELVDDLILDALLHISRQSIEHEIIVEPSDELFLARVDARLIIQVVINIVDNAIKYTPKGSQIKISTFYKDDKVAVSIADNGPGIPDEIKNKVFEMFYIGGNHIIDSHRSLGLGLALCKSIINAHNGDIYVTDAPQGGAVFTFTLPKGEVKINE